MVLWGAGFDEYSQQPSNIFSEIISKALADHLGYAIFFGTPKGKNEFHRIYKSPLNNPEWTTVFKTIDDSLQEEGERIQNLKQACEQPAQCALQPVASPSLLPTKTR
jgi:phage terminase large subunit